MLDNTTNGSMGPLDPHQVYTEDVAVYSVKSLFIIMIMLCTVVGNFISITVILRTRSMRTPSGNFVISLAVADFIVGAFVVPFSFAAAVKGQWNFPDSVCRGIGFVQFYSTTLSISNLMALTFDRWISVTRPMQYSRIMTNKTSYVCIVIIWVGVLLIDLPMMFPSVGSFYYMDGVYVCSPKWDANFIYTFILMSVYLLPAFTIVLVLNMRLLCISRKHVMKMNSLQKQTGGAPTITSLKTKLVVFVIVLTFEISWMPFFVVEIIKLFKVTTVNNHLTFIVSWMGISNSFMNSIIYTCLNRKFRLGVRTVLKCQKNVDFSAKKESLI